MILTKIIVQNKKIGNNWQTFINRCIHIIILSIIFALGFLNYSIPKEAINLFDIWILLVASSWLYVTYPLRRIAYANEKVSTLQPFAMLFQVFPVILWFIFITSERANIITFLMAILASSVVIITSIDFKKFKINKYSLMVLASSTIKSTQLFGVLYLLTKLSPASFYFTESIVIITISIIMISIKKEWKEIKLLTKKFLKLLIWANCIIIFSIILALTMYSTLWVVATSLISLLYLVFIYTLGYFILKETPSKKDILVTIFVAICIIIWILLKQ
jgi:drug/metabolite transporter (DMT)-like permease